MDLRTATAFIKSALQVEDVSDNDKARQIGITIFEAPVKFTGLVSKSLLNKNGYRSSTYCEEHFHSRQQAGFQIIEAYRAGKEITEEFVGKFTQVHRVSSAENIALSPIQNASATKNVGWARQYELAGIELVEDPGCEPSYFNKVYIIDNVVYNNIKDASQGTGESWDVIRKRCSSKAKIWKSWGRK